MRHGAGPHNSLDIKSEAHNLSVEMNNLSISDRGRLGCYFCNDVVAPIDVSLLSSVAFNVQAWWVEFKMSKITSFFFGSQLPIVR